MWIHEVGPHSSEDRKNNIVIFDSIGITFLNMLLNLLNFPYKIDNTSDRS